MASDLEQKIIRQIEYYFGDINLPRDKFLQEKIKEDDGWVTLEVLLTFNRLNNLSNDAEVIAAAVDKAENELVLLSEDRKKIRRNPEIPLPELDDDRKKELAKRTAYAKGFPLDEEFENIINFLEPYGPIDSCQRRSTPKDNKFKGSCFIIFKDIETCKKFVEAESIKYKDTELIRKFKDVYFADKKKEIEERNKAAKNKKGKNDDKPKLEFPKGAVLHFTGLNDGETLTREDLREKIKEIGDIEVAFVDFNKGDLEGYLRFSKENDAVEFMKKITDNELEVEKFKLKLKLLEGQEEEEYLSKTSDTVIQLRMKQKHNSRQNRKRKGNSGYKEGRYGKKKRD